MQDFLHHIKLKNQKFKCYLNTDPSNTLCFTVNIHNELNSGANEEEIFLLKKLIPNNNEEIVAFYKLFNGIKLYCNNDIYGIEFCSIKDLEQLNIGWKEDFSDYDGKLYNFQKGGVAFGNLFLSGTHFVLYEGKVFFDDRIVSGNEWVFAESFCHFLSSIIEDDPADFLSDLGAFTRYSDGETDRQYIPKKFIADET
jgi:hypothetical protein